MKLWWLLFSADRFSNWCWLSFLFSSCTWMTWYENHDLNLHKCISYLLKNIVKNSCRLIFLIKLWSWFMSVIDYVSVWFRWIYSRVDFGTVKSSVMFDSGTRNQNRNDDILIWLKITDMICLTFCSYKFILFYVFVVILCNIHVCVSGHLEVGFVGP